MNEQAPQGMGLWVERVARLGIAVILGQTLFFKFTGAAESVALFQSLGVEPWGRIGTGVFELLAILLLLRRPSVVYGALLTAGLMGGAILTHLLWLGLEVQGDGGALFGMAVGAFLLALVLLFLWRCAIPVLGRRLCPATAG